MIETIHTIGGYGHSKEGFFKKLEENGIDILVDIRKRRGMRGVKYSFLNSNALQIELSRKGIAYIHIKELAPTEDVRNAQKEEDKKSSEIKRNRAELSDRFKKEYRDKILVNSDASEIIQKIQPYRHPCFFCVEGPAKACHRSLVTEWLLKHENYSINNIIAL